MQDENRFIILDFFFLMRTICNESNGRIGAKAQVMDEILKINYLA